MHWMGAAEFLSDAVDWAAPPTPWTSTARPASCSGSPCLNLGNRVAASSYTDSALGRTRTRHRRATAGSTVRAEELSYPALVASIRAGRTFATNGGPRLPLPERSTARARATSCEPGGDRPTRCGPRSTACTRSDRSSSSAGASRSSRSTPTAAPGAVILEATVEDGPAAAAWYALRVEDERGHWAMTSPIYVEPPRRPAVDRRLGDDPGDQQRDPVHRAAPRLLRPPDRHRRARRPAGVGRAAPGRRGRPPLLPGRWGRAAEGKVPVTGIDGEYGPGWAWFPRPDAAHHFQADWPVAEPGWYGLRATTAGGRTCRSDEVRFDGPTGASRASSVARLDGPGTRFVHLGHGEEMPLESIRLPFEGDHWWYPERTFWQVLATFDGQDRSVGSDPNAEARDRFRLIDDPEAIGPTP